MTPPRRRGVQVFSKPCDTCVFAPGNRMHLRPGRLKDIVDRNLAAGAALICHKTIRGGGHPDIGETVCRGWFDAYGDQTNSLRVVRRYAAACGDPDPFTFIDPPDPEGDPDDDDNTQNV